MNKFITLSGQLIDLHKVISISPLNYHWSSNYGCYSYENDWFVELILEKRETPLELILVNNIDIKTTDFYNKVQKIRKKTEVRAKKEYKRLVENWSCVI